jgi:hypothetical protein
LFRRKPIAWLVLAENIEDWQRVGSRFHMTYVSLAKFFDVIQHVTQLLLKSIRFLFRQIDPRQSGNVRNIEIRGPSHGCRSGMQIADEPDNCRGKRDDEKEENNLAVASFFAQRTRTPSTSVFARGTCRLPGNRDTESLIDPIIICALFRPVFLDLRHLCNKLLEFFEALA